MLGYDSADGYTDGSIDGQTLPNTVNKQHEGLFKHNSDDEEQSSSIIIDENRTELLSSTEGDVTEDRVKDYFKHTDDVSTSDDCRRLLDRRKDVISSLIKYHEKSKHGSIADLNDSLVKNIPLRCRENGLPSKDIESYSLNFTGGELLSQTSPLAEAESSPDPQTDPPDADQLDRDFLERLVEGGSYELLALVQQHFERLHRLPLGSE